MRAASVANIRRVHSTLLLRGSVVSPLIIPNMGHPGDDWKKSFGL